MCGVKGRGDGRRRIVTMEQGEGKHTKYKIAGEIMTNLLQHLKKVFRID